MALNRAAILEAKDIPTETVPVPEWGGDVIVRGLTGDELDDYQGSIRQFRRSLVHRLLGIPRLRLLMGARNRPVVAAVEIPDRHGRISLMTMDDAKTPPYFRAPALPFRVVVPAFADPHRTLYVRAVVLPEATVWTNFRLLM